MEFRTKSKNQHSSSDQRIGGKRFFSRLQSSYWRWLLQEYLEKNNIVGIAELDTRLLVRQIRDKGAMNAIISSEDR